MNKIYLPDVVGRGYADYWSFTGRYRVCKGSRASKKSKTTALNFIYRLMKYPQANLLVVRKVFATLKDSCYTELKWAIHRFGADSLFECKLSPLEIVYKPTGQKIFFRGLDDPLKITSITVSTGALCWLWIEEAYEINDENDFNMVDESIRGQVPDGLFKQVTLTFNPWNEKHWIKRRFFDAKDPEVLAKTTNYMINEFLDESDIRVFEEMKKNNPRRYRVAGLGEWGIVEGLIYERWEERKFRVRDIVNSDTRAVFGLDFGYTNDPTALFCGIIDKAAKEIYVFDELYEKALSTEQTAAKICAMGYAKEIITADSAEPRTIDRLRELGIRRIKPARKGRDSINCGIDFLQDYKIIIDPRCENFIREIGNYSWEKDRTGSRINKPAAGFDHLMDAMRYAVEDCAGGDIFSFY
ncbi:MAG: PBSX family phage terminase large subunit [Firmicutes bacterium]|nr:PBSX family phage terminase large subunit [Bacillota bacterium]